MCFFYFKTFIGTNNPARQQAYLCGPTTSHNLMSARYNHVTTLQKHLFRGRIWQFVLVQIRRKRTTKITSAAFGKLSFSSVLLMNIYFYTESTLTWRMEQIRPLTGRRFYSYMAGKHCVDTARVHLQGSKTSLNKRQVQAFMFLIGVFLVCQASLGLYIPNWGISCMTHIQNSIKEKNNW